MSDPAFYDKVRQIQQYRDLVMSSHEVPPAEQDVRPGTVGPGTLPTPLPMPGQGRNLSTGARQELKLTTHLDGPSTVRLLHGAI